MGNRADDKTQTLDRTTRFAGQADDERLIHDCGQIAGKDGVFRDLHGFGAHHFAKSGEFTNGDFPHCFRRYIAQGHAGAAGSQALSYAWPSQDDQQ